LLQSQARPHRCCIPPARSSGALPATSTRAKCLRQLGPHSDRSVAACTDPLLQLLSKMCGRCRSREGHHRHAGKRVPFPKHAALVSFPENRGRKISPRQAFACRGFCSNEASMAEKKGPTKRARQPRTKTRQTAESVERIEQWSKSNGDDAHSESMLELLARGLRPAKRKVQRIEPDRSHLCSRRTNRYPVTNAIAVNLRNPNPPATFHNL
jgi:hypothetical protein